ncbi:Serine protease, subtilisin family [Fervidobacterium gondwanense DSM 13020]|uniref:Serine protease, subtilisin family n=2 Tax=Fervidobacterium gondwanense TaxID=44754 RepID=A0A1M7TDR3_FERGO|nr:Serine protease, subtilisin family [Fervidobacterium gondwanense DSM 13020]
MMRRLSSVLLVVALTVVLLFVFACTPQVKNGSNVDNKPAVNKPISKVTNQPVLFGELIPGEYFEGKVLVGYENRDAALEVVKLLNGKIVVDLPQIKMISVKFNGKVADAYAKIKEANIKGIRYVEPSYKRELIEPLPVKGDIEKESNFEPRVTSATSPRGNEEFSNLLWGVEAVGATEVWSEASGTDVIVAVVDSGVDGTHPDLEGQVIEGYRPAFDKELPAGTDSSYGGAHGTHVAGTIAAKKDGKGIVGVAPNAKIMPIVIFDDPALVGGNGYVGDDFVAAGIIWAVENGAKVMNHSWGGSGYSHTLKYAFDYAMDNGVVMVASSGNDYSKVQHKYPGGYPGVIRVAAIEYNGGQYRTTGFSTKADSVVIGGPGVKILSTVPLPESLGYEGESVVSDENEGTYDYYEGTSMAAPHVTGVVVLLFQKHPNAKPWQIRKLIESTAKDIDKPGFDEYSGYGLVNVKRAFASTLPTSGGATLDIVVTDAYESWRVPSVFVTLKKKIDGRYFAYYAKTDINGIAHFPAIDTGEYEVIIGGPDSYERCESPYGFMAYYTAMRMEEERQINDTINLTADATKTYKFTSEFKVKFGTPYTGASLVVKNLLTDEVEELPYNTNVKNLSEKSGLLQLSVKLSAPAPANATLNGTATINGYDIPVVVNITTGATEALVVDYLGDYFGTMYLVPPMLWWTVFGKN